jgi:hypothetical protein
LSDATANDDKELTTRRGRIWQGQSRTGLNLHGERTQAAFV